MFRFFILFLSSASMLFLISGCNETPSSVGKGIVSKDFGVINIKTLYATNQSTIYNQLYTSDIDRVMLGKYPTTYEVWTCLKFSGWPDSLLSATITSAKIQLKPFYQFGDSGSSLSFDVYRATASWEGDSLTYDSLIMPNAYYDNNRICQGNVNPQDSSVVFDIINTISDTLGLNYGFILSPKTGNSIRGFYSFNNSNTALLPTLSVGYVNANGAGTYTLKTGISKYVAHVDPNLFVNNPDGKMRVQNGISYRGILDLNSTAFDSLVLLWPFSIHQAFLQITLDSASSSCNFTPFANNPLLGLSVGTDNIVNGINIEPGVQLSGSNIYQFDVSSMLPAWINNIYARKIAFSGYPESGSFDLFTFYGSGSISNLKPKLIITYSAQR